MSHPLRFIVELFRDSLSHPGPFYVCCLIRNQRVTARDPRSADDVGQRIGSQTIFSVCPAPRGTRCLIAKIALRWRCVSAEALPSSNSSHTASLDVRRGHRKGPSHALDF